MKTDIDAMREIHRQAVIARDWEDFELVVDNFPAILDELETAREEIVRLREDLAHIKETMRILTHEKTMREIVAATTAATETINAPEPEVGIPTTEHEPPIIP